MAGQQHVRTMFDYADERQWIGMLGWSDEELRSVPVYEEFDSGQETINLTNFGGTSLGVIAGPGSPTSADAQSVHNLWVYRNTTPPQLWQRLCDLVNQGGPVTAQSSGAANLPDAPSFG